MTGWPSGAFSELREDMGSMPSIMASAVIRTVGRSGDARPDRSRSKLHRRDGQGWPRAKATTRIVLAVAVPMCT